MLEGAVRSVSLLFVGFSLNLQQIRVFKSRFPVLNLSAVCSAVAWKLEAKVFQVKDGNLKISISFCCELRCYLCSLHENKSE